MEKDENLEDVGSTLKKIKSKRKKPGRKEMTLQILEWVFFPVGLTRMLFKKLKVRLTTKTTVIFTLIFGILIIAYVFFALFYFKSFFEREQIEASSFLSAMAIISTILVITFLFIGSVAGAAVSHIMLRPIRRIITQVDGINGDNLSQRLETVDTHDEISELIQQINSMLQSLEQSFEQQSNFVGDASHELKTPLSVITGYGNLLDRWGKNDPAVLDEGIEAIKRESAYMAKIIDQLLLLARLGQFSMVRQRFDLSQAATETVAGYQVINKECNISLTTSGPLVIEADKNLLIEALRAIIDNAIKYSPDKGEIKVYVLGEEMRLVIGVKDNGVGIPEKDLPHIFDRFYRCDKTRGREKGSAGLGLTICKSIIEMMGGRISVESEKGRGTEFKIVFPITEKA